MGLVIAGLLAAQLPNIRSTRGLVADRAALRQALLLGMLTVVGFGVGNAIRGLAIREWNEAAIGAMLGSAAALLCQLATGSSVGTLLRDLRKGENKAIGLYIASGVITVSGTMFGAMAMHRVEIAIATVVTYTTPLVVFPVSVFLLKNREALNLRTMIGSLLVLVGIVLLAFR
jgi:drug/metabolite transporter (DMT)-like permease